MIAIPTESGKPQEMARCPKCSICVWSYVGLIPLLSLDHSVLKVLCPTYLRSPSNSIPILRHHSPIYSSLLEVLTHCQYGGNHLTRFVRVGTLDDPDQFPPDIHIFTRSKQRWLNLEGCGKPVVEECRHSLHSRSCFRSPKASKLCMLQADFPKDYSRKQYWPEASLERRERMIAKGKIDEVGT